MRARAIAQRYSAQQAERGCTLHRRRRVQRDTGNSAPDERVTTASGRCSAVLLLLLLLAALQSPL